MRDESDEPLARDIHGLEPEAAGHLTNFRDPGDLSDAELRLAVTELYPGDPAAGWVPAYRFAILVNDIKVGVIELRLGTTHFLVQFAGQVGYGINPAHRGNRYAARALRLIMPLARRHGLCDLWVTVDPANWASRRTCELVGAAMVEIVDLPEDCEMYQEGYRQRCRYLLRC